MSHEPEAGEDDLSAHERSRLRFAAAERDRLERALALLPRALSEFQPLTVSEVLAAAACELTGARIASVVHPELLAHPVAAGPDIARFDPVFDPSSLAMVQPAFDGNVVYVSDSERLEPAAGANDALRTIEGRKMRSVLAIPLVRGETGGIVVLAHHRAAAFSDRQIALLSPVVSHLGQLVEMCETVRTQTRIAVALQESLLPPVLPLMDDVELAARYRPSGSGNLVGGDFYDFFADSVGGWYVLLGDASGIGPEAAGLAGIARYTARALAEPGPEPSEILKQINTALVRASYDDRFCTAVLSRFVPTGAGCIKVAFASGGHPPAYIQRRDGHVEVACTATGLILGIVEDGRVATADLLLGPGDAIVFYTDGIIEARSAAGEPFGEAGVVAVLEEATNRSAEGIARRLERAVLDHRSPGERDDMAIAVVRVRPAN